MLHIVLDIGFWLVWFAFGLGFAVSAYFAREELSPRPLRTELRVADALGLNLPDDRKVTRSPLTIVVLTITTLLGFFGFVSLFILWAMKSFDASSQRHQTTPRRDWQQYRHEYASPDTNTMTADAA